MTGNVKKTPRTMLTNMAISEISLCHSPASTGSDVAIFKSNFIHGEAFERGLEILADTPEGAQSFKDAVEKSEALIGKSIAEGAELPKNHETELSCAIYALAKSIASIYNADDEALEGSVQKSTDDFAGWLSDYIGKGDCGMANTNKTKADPEGTGKIKHKEHIDKNVDAGKFMDDGSIIQKSGDPINSGASAIDMTQFIAKSDIAEIIKSATGPLEAKIAKMEEERDSAALIAKASALVKGVPHITAEQCATVLKALEGNDAAIAAYESSLKVSKQSFGSNYAQELGASGVPDLSDNPNQQIEKMASAIIAKAAESGNTVSHSEAMTQVVQENPHLYAEVRRRRLTASAGLED
jgi:hypothetical protein